MIMLIHIFLAYCAVGLIYLFGTKLDRLDHYQQSPGRGRLVMNAIFWPITFFNWVTR